MVRDMEENFLLLNWYDITSNDMANSHLDW